VTSPLTITDLLAYKANGWQPDPEYPSNMLTFWSPIDDVHGALKAILGSAKRSIVIQMYGYDDDELAEMVAHAIDNPAMYVQVTLDKSQAGGVHEKALLERWKHEMTGNSVAIGTSEKGAIQHRKCMLIDGIWRVTGSTNWSTSGETLQDNELTVTQSASVVAEARTVLDIEHDAALSQQAKRAAVLAKAGV
jgi:phosphatidylserine/phosphatidylglycerophosphate/cardiolipin synthase-like enzyme